MQHTIEEAQAKINNIYHDNIEAELPYNKYIIPIVTPILQELKTIPPEEWYRQEKTDPHIDAYVEALSLYMIYNYVNNISIEYPLFAVVLVLVKHTFFIHIFQYNKNIEEWNVYRKILYNEFETIKSTIPYRTGITKLQYLIEKDIVIPENPSSITLFNQLFGFTYDKNNNAMFLEHLLTNIHVSETTGFIVIHLSYNLKELQSLIICTHVQKSKTKILNINNIELSLPFEYPEYIHVSNDAYTFIDFEGNIVQSLSDCIQWRILLCYDDNNDAKLCHYTLVDQESMNQQEAERFVNKSVINKIDPKLLSNALHDDYISNISFKFDSSERIAKNITYLTTIVKNIFNDSINQNEFVTKLLLDQDELLKIMDKSELPYFKIYMSHYNNSNIFDYESAYNYVSGYFGIDAALMIGDLI